MYYSHFGLKEPPFKITPNTEFFFAGSNRGAVLDALIYAITSGEGIVKVVGEVGSGKTMLCRMLQNMLPENVESIYLANPSVAPEDILHAIAFELGIKLTKTADRLKVMQALQKYLLDRHEAGKRVVIFVEEAQGMPLATLEEIRLLSNLETKHDKLLQMVLFGQPELDDNLNQSQIRQLRERITHGFNLSPLRPKEVGEYLIFRLRAAGYHGPHLFSDKAIKKIAKAAEGLVRRVNILADKSLLAAFADNVYLVTTKHVKAAIADSEFGAERARKTNRNFLILGILGVMLAGLLLGYLAHLTYQEGLLSQLLKHQSQNEAQKATDVLTNSTPALGQQSTAKLESANKETVENRQNLAPTSTPATPKVEQPVTGEGNADILEARLAATQRWLSGNAKEMLSIQILGAADRNQLRQQLALLTQSVALDNLYVYQTTVNGKAFYTVLYGSFPDRLLAYDALKKLPESIQVNRPHLRTVGGILEETHKNN
jgi:type II secretory pathway predicted ATPase ExeA